MDWNNFFMPGQSQNYNFVPGGFPPANANGAVYQNNQQNWQYYPTYNQNYISEPSSLQPIVSPLVSSPYGGAFSHTSGDYQERSLGSGMVSTFPVANRSGMHLNEGFSSPTDALASILSASSLTPTAGEFVPRSRSVQIGEHGNADNSKPQELLKDVSGTVSKESQNASEVVKEFENDECQKSNNSSKSFQSIDGINNAQWENVEQKVNSPQINSTDGELVKDSAKVSEGKSFHSSKNYDCTQGAISVSSRIRTSRNEAKEKNTEPVDELKNFHPNNTKMSGHGHETSVRKGSGRILQNRMSENMKGSSSRDSKNQGRQRLLAEAAAFYTSTSTENRHGADGVGNNNTHNKSFDWQAHREVRHTNRDAYSNNGRNYKTQIGNRRENRTTLEYDNAHEGNSYQEREKSTSGGRTYFSQNDSIRFERSDRGDRRDRREKNDPEERRERGDKNDRGENNDLITRKDRVEKGERHDRGNRSDRNDRGERNDQLERRDKSERSDWADKRDRNVRWDRSERGERNDRGGKNNKGEKDDRGNRSDKAERSDTVEKNNRGEQTDWNDRSNRKWDRSDKRDRNEKAERNERIGNWVEKGSRNERDSRSNQGSRNGRQEGADRNDSGKYQKTFYSSRFSSRNSDLSPNSREIPLENSSAFLQNRNRRYAPNTYTNEPQVENDNNFLNKYETNSGPKRSSFLPNELSASHSDSNLGSNHEENNVTTKMSKIYRGGSEEKNLKILPSDFKSDVKIAQRQMNTYTGQVHHSDDEASQRERLSEQLSRGALECLVCCDRVRQHDAVWSCNNCYHVLHLRCIKKWARSSRAESGWRCPACQNVNSKMPQEYRCFCGKMHDPEWNRQDIPHSCGEVCGRTRGQRASELGPCIHRCTLLCHPGPCPPCMAQVNRECGCGKTSQIVTCGNSQPLLCEAPCDKLLNCQLHRCTKICHWGACGDCEQIIKQECFCGKNSQEVTCTEETVNMKHYSCKEVCSRTLECKNHTCTSVCHDGECAQCEFMPSRVAHCPCGKTPLSEDCKRTSCLDPVPTCGQPCEKQLSCGLPGNYHRCQAECHTGPCPQCPLTTIVKCRCGHMDREIECKELTTKADDARCEKRCSKKRACGKHKCNQMCCIDVDHQCPLICNHVLSCGKHRCEDLCHRGHCQPCWRTSFEELYCECGASVIFPPVPCGTRRPLCTKPCSRQHPCQHEALHKCHSEPSCPPCTVLMEKYCYGKHELRKAVPCHQTEFSCGMPCGLPLPCGRHSCIMPCHKGPCVREGQPVCTQPCKILRTLCGHPCAAPCHDGACPDTPCKETVRVTCECGHRSTSRPCCDQIKEYRRVMTALLASKMQDVQLGHAVDIDDLGGSSARAESLKTLECSDECKIIERNRRLAIGLQIRNPDLSSKLQPRYSEFIRQWGKKDPFFVSMVHDKLTELVQLAKQSKQKSRSYSFSSMNRDKRHFIHEYCEHFGCESQAYDPEPNRNVVATAQRDRAWLPSMSLLEVLQRESGQRKVPKPVTARAVDTKIKESPTVHTASQVKAGEGSSKSEKEKEKEKEKEVEIDYFEYTS